MGWASVLRYSGDSSVISSLSAIEVLGDADRDRLLLVIAQRISKDSSAQLLCVNGEICAAALTPKIKRIAGKDANGLVVRRVIDLVLAGELQMAVRIVPIEAQRARRQRQSQAILCRVHEFPRHPDVRVRLRA